MTKKRLQLVKIAAEDRELKPSTLRLFIALVWEFPSEQIMWPRAIENVGAELGIRDRAIRTAKRQLLDKGYLREKHPGCFVVQPNHSP